jgi:1-acyl-sn-glycerol-3-phosphate acyltransferase
VADLVYPPVIRLARTVFAGLGLKFDITGADNVPRSGGAVMVINHVGYLDFTFAGLAAQPSKRLVRFMAKESVFRHPVSGPLMRGMHHIPVDRAAGAQSYRAAVSALRAGEIVGVFPEATISRSFELKAMKSGAARMAAEAGVPLLPVVIWGSQRVMTKGLPRNLRRAHIPISIAVARPIPLPPGADPSAATEALVEVMTTTLHRLQATYPDRPAGPTDTWWLPARLGGSAPTLQEANALDRAEQAAAAQARRAERAAARSDEAEGTDGNHHS